MVKLLLITSIILLQGCSLQWFTRTEIVETKVPILYCPKPNIPERPTLLIHTMTPEQKSKDGEVAKRYKASIIQLQGYSSQLETSLQSCNNANVSYDELKKEIEEKLNK